MLSFMVIHTTTVSQTEYTGAKGQRFISKCIGNNTYSTSYNAWYVPINFHTTQAKLQWKRCADTPVEMSRPQAVVMGEKVYIGGGNTKHVEDNQYVFQYNPSRDEWSRLPPCQVIFFPMAQFMGHLITVGGAKLSSTGLLQGITSFLRRSLIGGFTVTQGRIQRLKKGGAYI